METNSLAISNKSLIISEPILQPRQGVSPFEMLATLYGWHRVVEHPAFAVALFSTAAMAIATAIVVPIIALTRLFNLILDAALYAWAANPPSNQVVLEAGNLRIEFGCSLEPVPWEFIAWYATSQRDAVARGFMGVFDKEWWFQKNRTGGLPGRLCYVGMRVVEEGRVVVPPVNESDVFD